MWIQCVLKNSLCGFAESGHKFQGSMSVQVHMTKFNKLTFHYDLQDDRYQTISKFHFELYADIQRDIYIYSRNVSSPALACQLVENIERCLKFSTNNTLTLRAKEQPI